jgi:hypothetical protein
MIELLLVVAQIMSRPLDIAFRVHMVDPGFSESVAVADFNKGRPTGHSLGGVLVRGAAG